MLAAFSQLLSVPILRWSRPRSEKRPTRKHAKIRYALQGEEAVAERRESEDPALRPEARLGAALRRAREDRGISLRALARKFYRSHSNLVEYERGHRLAPPDVVQAYEAELGVARGTLMALHEQARIELLGEDRLRRQSYSYIPKSSPQVPHQLPPDVAHFTGRRGELAQLHILLAKGSPRTVVISAIAGTAGVGKTALAVHLAHKLASHFPDAQLYVNLRGYEPHQRLSPTQVLDRFLRALGVASEALPTNLEEQVALYRSLLADRHALVVLDNASSADQVRPLLPASPTCLALVTSRDHMAGLVAQEGARLINLDVLTPEEAVELLAHIIGADRVGAEAEAAVTVAKLCGYLPLAISIAGARLVARPAMSVTDLAARLVDERRRLGELSVGDIEVRASFALSYQSLDPAVARMFRRLGLIAGPAFAPGVAAALIDATPEEAETLLEVLVDAHLLEVAPIPGRYRFHDLLRLYARERVEVEEAGRDRDAALRRALDWYVDTADAADRLIIPGRRRLPYEPAGRRVEPVFESRAQALAWFEVERASLVAAARQAADCGLYAAAWQIPDAMLGFFYIRNYLVDLQSTHQVGLIAAREARNQQAEARMLTSLGRVAGPDCYQEALTISQQIGDRWGESRALHRLGAVHLNLRQFAEALDCYREALAIAQKIGDRYREAATLGGLGIIHCNLRQFEKAISWCSQGLKIFREIGDRWGEGIALHNLGEAYREPGQFAEAIDYYQQALASHREAGARYFEGRALDCLGFVLERTQDVNAAQACWREAFAIFAELGVPEADEVRARLEEGPEDSQTQPLTTDLFLWPSISR
jgi:tetratricopeptide (TPR) repeat protein/transcriptional regulator with XRE-family HTH domain